MPNDVYEAVMGRDIPVCSDKLEIAWGQFEIFFKKLSWEYQFYYYYFLVWIELGIFLFFGQYVEIDTEISIIRIGIAK